MTSRKFTVRLREITFYDFVVEAQSYKEAVSIINEMIVTDLSSLQPYAVGVRYEIESITPGGANDRKPIRTKPKCDPPLKRLRTERMAVQNRRLLSEAKDCESGADESRVSKNAGTDAFLVS